MPEYIEREKVHRLVRSLNRYAWNNPDKSEYRTTVDIDDVQFGIDKIPTADVVEIVRCKDCIFSRELDKYEKKLYLDNCVGCTKHSKSYHSLIMEDNDFCGYGERREVKNNA